MMTQTALRDYLQATEDAIHSKQLDEALSNCQKILAQYPESLEGQRLLGEIYLAQDNFKDAQRSFDWILTSDPENVMVYCNRAIISDKQGDYDTALDCYQQAYELSRNSQIRQIFNQLSARVDQPGFMFSRAGLARLYMRGDLLDQAVQEWEVVLTEAPDRFDARVGLLETYWRDGFYDQAERVANQLLEEYPTCLKALLILAHVVSARNISQAEDFLRRSMALDPDMIMGQQLFSDLFTSQSTDPFLQLLDKGPASLHDEPITQPSARQQPASGPHNLDSVHNAGSLFEWQTFDQSQEEQQKSPSSSPDWNNGDWASYNSQSDVSSPSSHQTETPAQPQAQADDSFDEQSLYRVDQVVNNPLSLSGLEPSAPSTDAQSSWSNLPVDFSGFESFTSSDHHNTASPEWMDMLNIQQAPSTTPTNPEAQNNSTSSLEKSTPSAFEVPKTPEIGQVPPEAHEQTLDKPATSIHAEPEDALPPFGEDDGDTNMGWFVDWLKSEGAPEIDPDQPSTAMPAIKIPPQEHLQTEPDAKQPQKQDAFLHADQSQAPRRQITNPLPSTELATSSVEPEAPAVPDWQHQLQGSWQQPQSEASSLQQPEQQPAVPDWQHQLENHNWQQPEQQPAVPDWQQPEQQPSSQEEQALHTLEQLDKHLRSEGFQPMEMGSLSEIAQASENAELASENADKYEQPLPSMQQPQEQQNPPKQSYPEVPNYTSEGEQFLPDNTPENTRQPEVGQSSTESLYPWSEMLSPGAESEPQRAEPVQPEATPTYQQHDWQQLPNVQPEQITQPMAIHQSSQTPETSDISGSVEKPAPSLTETGKMAALRADTLLDGELETTMRRPAIRLQPIKHRNGEPSGRSLLGRNRPAAERPITHKTVEDSQERLLRGYQYQLSGAYDDAMNEYRMIIRSNPELLGEVISNMRALLKLAPKYAAGYRVLGDAYMRQGEYLQAMEAYNKALTMTKKGKGH